MAYNKAPISEVICGVFFPMSVFSADDISRINVSFLNDYPNREILPPIYLEMFRNRRNMRLVPSGSNVLSLTRRYSSDGHFLVQFQENCFYLNWIRSDDDDVGKYPRFDGVYEKFSKEFDKVKSIKNLDEFMLEAFFELTYCDRFYLTSTTDKKNIQDYMSIKLPIAENNNEDSCLNFRQTIAEKKLNGSAFLEVSTNYSPSGYSLADFRYIIRGNSVNGDMNKWFDAAHNRQLDVFDNIFTEKAKEEWK